MLTVCVISRTVNPRNGDEDGIRTRAGLEAKHSNEENKISDFVARITTQVTLDELIHDLNGATVFSKLDLSSGYHQLELHPLSRYITTFRTHNGICSLQVQTIELWDIISE